MHTGSDLTMTFAADCIRECEQTHRRCSIPSPDDWQKEAARMKDVYSQARFNISATGAHTSDDGLFFDRERLALAPFVVNVEAPDSSESWKTGRYYLLNPSVWSSNISKAPLNK